MNDINTTIGKRIRHRRQELGISQSEFAKSLGYKTQASVSKLENGEQDIPITTLMVIAKELRTTVVFLTFGKGNTETKNLSTLHTNLTDFMNWFNSKNNKSSMESIGIPAHIASKIKSKQAKSLSEAELQLAFEVFQQNQHMLEEAYKDVKAMNEALNNKG